ncbi:MAG TPA: MazG nucleotide pyrophosphohydrolase domain-containing protein [Rhizomicrobium sp.]|nr:MazG nucleotide pyrophosphohydrolase domain-containing protein [Rhizomicrobium sp.]
MDFTTADMGDPLDILAEECGEVIQAIMKHRRFGHTSAQSAAEARQRIVQEIGDLVVAVSLLQDPRCGAFLVTPEEIATAAERKYDKLRALFGYRRP